MAQEQETVSAGTWRVYKAASAALSVMPRHREQVLGVDDVERELAPAIHAFRPAAGALRSFLVKRDVAQDEHVRRLQQLRLRTQFWLTYVRLNVATYVASEMAGRWNGDDVVIDRARGVIELGQSYLADQAPRYVAPMLAELVPMYDQCIGDQLATRERAEEEQRLRSKVRDLIVPVYRSLLTLRALLRNALGASHVDVRALDTDTPSKQKRKDAEVAANAPELAEDLTAQPTAPTTAQRLALVRG